MPSGDAPRQDPTRKPAAATDWVIQGTISEGLVHKGAGKA